MFGVAATITASAYQPRGVIGAVVWASPDPGVDVGEVLRRGPASSTCWPCA